MAKPSKVTLEDFIKKSVKKYQDRKTSVEIEIENLGIVVFSRPTENELLGYMNHVSSAVKTDDKGNVMGQDLNVMLDASKDLIYPTCGYLSNSELQKSLDVIDPLDVVTKVFGVTKTIEIASQIATEFMDEEIENKIKN